MLDIITRNILAMLGEFHREAVIRALVQAGQIALDDEPGLQFQAAHLGERQGIEVAFGVVGHD
jgi:hypothetical protein